MSASSPRSSSRRIPHIWRRGRHHFAARPTLAADTADHALQLDAADAMSLTQRRFDRRWPPDFDVTRRGSTLYLQGELDLSCLRLIAQAGADMIDARADASSSAADVEGGVAGDVVIDAAELRFIDASGLGALVSLSHALATAGTGIRTINSSSQLRQLCRICGLDATLGLPAEPAPAPPAPSDSPGSGSAT